MSVWDWVHEFHAKARANGDRERLRMYSLLEDYWKYNETNLEQALVSLREGRQLAQQLGERRWELLFDHWRLQLQIHHAADFRDVLDLAVKSTLTASKPEFADLPQRICLHEDLIYSYVKIDPFGYEPLIEQALAYMEKEITPGVECRFCTEGCRARFEINRDNLDAARASALRLLAMADAAGNDHHANAAYGDLCWVAYRQEDFVALGEWAMAGEEVARRLDRKHDIAEFLMWQAVVVRQARDEPAAQRLVCSATARMARLGIPPAEEYFEAWTAYHELGENWLDALRILDLHLKTISGKGQHIRECKCHLHRCRLLARLGRPLSGALTEARTAAMKLRKPERVLVAIERMAAGEE